MDLREPLRRWASARPRVLIADAPGRQALRWAVEAAIDVRGWEFAVSPADTDVLLVIGEPGPDLSDAIEVVWSQVPRPRSRMLITDAALVDDQLNAALDRLISTPAADQDPLTVSARGRLAAAGGSSGHEAHAGHDVGGPGADHSASGFDGGHGHQDMDMGGHAGHDMGAPSGDSTASADGGHASHGMDMGGHAGHDMGAPSGDSTASADGGHAGHGMDMGGHAGHDMDGHGMHHGGMVAGLPMAQTAQDRDGLDLDTLSVALGPILPSWPTGLVMRAQLQGDVLTDVVLSWIDDHQPTRSPADVLVQQLTALDHVAHFLVVAGWGTAARRARRVQADLTSTNSDARSTAQDRARRLARQIRRSRALTWSVRGIGHLPRGPVGEHREGKPGSAADVLDRLHRWCDQVAEPTGTPPTMPMPLADLAAALDGTELATARLIVASFELDRTAALSEETVAGV